MAIAELTETFADVAALIPRFQWELMDEELRDAFIEGLVFPRYMKTTTDGVQLGPKAWGEWVGASPSAIKSRVQRLQKRQVSEEHEGSSTLSSSDAAARRHARRVLRDADADTVREIAKALPTAQLDAVSEAVHEEAVGRARAQRGERDTTAKEPTAGDLMEGEPFDPSASWANTRIISAHSAARKLHGQVEKWGLVLGGSFAEEEAYEMLDETERWIAGVRAAVQERLRDQRVHEEV